MHIIIKIIHKRSLLFLVSFRKKRDFIQLLIYILLFNIFMVKHHYISIIIYYPCSCCNIVFFPNNWYFIFIIIYFCSILISFSVKYLHCPIFISFTSIFPILLLCNACTFFPTASHIFLTCLFFPSWIVISNLEICFS